MTNESHSGERSLRQVLEQHNPQPSARYDQRMTHAPWNNEGRTLVKSLLPRPSRLTIRLAAVALALAVVAGGILMTPSNVRANVLSWLGWRPVGATAVPPIASTPASSNEPRAFAGTYSSQGPAASSPGRIVSLALALDDGIVWSTDYQNGKPAIVEVGKWRVVAPGRIEVTITGTETRAYDKPKVVVFELRDDALVAVEYEQKLFGSAGLQLWRVEP